MDFIAIIAIIFIYIISFAIPAYVWGIAIIGVGAMKDNIPEVDNKRGWLKNIFICTGMIIAIIPFPWLVYKGCRQAIRERIQQAGYSSYHLLCFSLGILFIILFTICIVLVALLASAMKIYIVHSTYG